MIEVLPYRPELASLWNAFVASSRNGTFLFDRGYMDYHAERFEDASLIFTRAGKWLALLPANRRGPVLESHGGLTYGGLVLAPEVGLERVAALLNALGAHARAAGVARIVYKTIPSIYHRAPAEEDRWALFRMGARLVRRDALTVIAAGHPALAEVRRRGLKKAVQAGAVVGESTNWAEFWPVLTGRLHDSHGVQPVHSQDEITLLAARFPRHIRLRTATLGREVVAGIVTFETDRVVHCQYVASNDRGRETRVIDIVHQQAIDAAHARGLPFDFGTSMENGGADLNGGLQAYKESYGARTVMHDYYEIDL